MGSLTTTTGDYAATEFGQFRGNGNNDDGPGISSALLAISALGGGRYVFPPGVTVGVGTTILQPSQVELVIPTSCTLKALPGLVGPMIANLDQVNGNPAVRVSGGGIIDGSRATVGAAATAGISYVKCDDAQLEEILIQNCYADGLLLDTCRRPLVDVTCLTNGRDGARFSTVTFPAGRLHVANNGQRVAGNGLTLLATSTDAGLFVQGSDAQGSPTQQWGVQEIAASGCDRNFFVGSCFGNVAGQVSLIGASSKSFQTFTTPTTLTATGRVQLVQGANVASANNLTLGNDGNVFVITGSVQIQLLDSTGWQSGSIVTLIFNAAVTLRNQIAASGAFRPLVLAGAGDYVAGISSTLTLVLYGGNWFEIGRTSFTHTMADLDSAQTFSGVKTFSADPILAKEINHTVQVANTTTNATPGGNLAVQAGAGGPVSGAGGNASVIGGAATAGNSSGGSATAQGGVGFGSQSGGVALLQGGVGGATGAAGNATVQGGAAAGGSVHTGGTSNVIGGTGDGAAGGGTATVAGGSGGSTGPGGDANVTGGNGGASGGAGGAASLTGGSGFTNSNGGAATVTGGAGGGTGGNGGAATLAGGNSTANNQNGGQANVTGGSANGSGNAGNAVISGGAGNAVAGAGAGSAFLQGGAAGAGSGSNGGRVQLLTGAKNGAGLKSLVELDALGDVPTIGVMSAGMIGFRMNGNVLSVYSNVGGVIKTLSIGTLA